ncbi:hypothetical protein BDV98DRAFT_605845 [Pterulicium gracile]|uniref:DUF6593 domain-containing protein n=1 Tax=Pterulicium gracile TaxID=1884261 RepID=A0A5C3QDQ8_9AGAR|nr:hypothetical protein BDV98DRAFT_605845 [Pterula gracilis]
MVRPLPTPPTPPKTPTASLGEPKSPLPSPPLSVESHASSKVLSPSSSQSTLVEEQTLHPELSRILDRFPHAPSPTDGVHFDFAPSTSNSMVCRPRGSKHQSIRSYNIAAQMNCFIPGTYTTIVRRGEDESGEVVGDFELYAPDRLPVVSFLGEEKDFSTLLLRTGSDRVPHCFLWTPAKLSWDCRQTPHICVLEQAHGPHVVVAKFTSSRRPRRQGETALPQAELEVLARGMELMDDILLSILIIEQIRLRSGTRRQRRKSAIQPRR